MYYLQSYVVASDSRVSIGSTKNIVTITPNANFDVNTSYYVSIDVGAFVNESNNANFAGLSSTLAVEFHYSRSCGYCASGNYCYNASKRGNGRH